MSDYRNFDKELDNFTYYKMILNKYEKNYSIQAIVDLLNIINMTLYSILIGKPWIIILSVLFIVKILLLFFKNDSLFNIIGLVFNLFAFILFYRFEGFAVDSFFYLTISCIIHFRGLKGNIIKNKLSNFYGYPSFNEIIIRNEMNNNADVYNVIISDIELSSNDYILKHELQNIKFNTITKTKKVFNFICLSMIILGCSLISYSNIQKNHVKNAIDFNSNYTIKNNLYVKGNIEQILVKASSGDENCYWVPYKDKYLYITVPKKISNSYNNLCADSTDVKNNIVFVGKFKNTSDKNTINKIPLKKVLNKDETSPLIIDNYVLEVINTQKNNYNKYFIIIILLGTLGLLSKTITNFIKNKLN